MQTEYISKRQVKVPENAPAALSSLLSKTQEGLNEGGGLDTVRWLHDSLAFLTEFFASFAVGALNTVGPYSASVQKLLEQPPSLDRSERLLSQAFVDWKAHPHHPAYESLRDSFFLTSRLQSSRFAPRRHTRWLGVEGRAVVGLERLTRWSRRIDLVVSGKDEEGAKTFVHTYTPVLWIWTDAVEKFFENWTVDVVTQVKDGSLGLAGSASKSDVRLDLVPIAQIAGLKCRYESDGNGGVTIAGFAGASVAQPSTSSLEPAPTPIPTQEPVGSASEEAEEDLQLVFDPASGNFVPKSGLPEEPETSTPAETPTETPAGLASPSLLAAAAAAAAAIQPDGIEVPPDPISKAGVQPPPPEAPLFAVEKSEPEGPEKPLFATPDGPVDFRPDEDVGEILSGVPSPDGLDDVPSPEGLDEVPSPDGLDDVPSPEELDEVPSPDGLDDVPSPEELDEVPSPDGLDDVPSPEGLDEVPSPDGLDDVPSPAELDEVPSPDGLVPPKFETPKFDPPEFVPPELPDLGSPGLDLSTPGDLNVQAPDLTLPGEAAPLPDFSVPPLPDFGSPPETASSVPGTADTAQTPAEVVEAPVEVAETPAEVLEAPVEVAPIESPAEVTETPAEVVEAPVEVAPIESPAEVTETPAEVVEDPVEVAPIESPAEVVEAPVKFVRFERPAKVTETPAEVVEAPVEVAAPIERSDEAAEKPAEVVEAPPIESPAELPETPDEVVEAPPIESPAELPETPDEVVEAPPIESPAVPETPDVGVEAPPIESPAELPETPDEVVEAPLIESPAVPETPDVGVEAPPIESPAVPETPDVVVEAPPIESPAVPETPDVVVEAPPIESPAVPETPDVVVEAPPIESPAEVPEAPDEVVPPVVEATEVPVPSVPDLSVPPVPPTPVPDLSSPPEVPQMDLSPTSEVEPTMEMMTPVATPPLNLGTPPPTGDAPVFDLSKPPETGAPSFTSPAFPPDLSKPGETSGVPPFEPSTDLPQTAPVFQPPAAEDSEESIPPTMEVPLDSMPAPEDKAETASTPSVEQTIEFDVASPPPEEQSVEIETPAANREMGVAAEEILEDDYKFSAEDGPARPHWTGWSVDQRETVQGVCEQLIEQRKTQKAESFVNPIVQALSGSTVKVQVLMEPACGKTHLAESLAMSMSADSVHVPLLASWDGSSAELLPGQVLLDFYNQLKASKRKMSAPVALPEPETVVSLAISADKTGFPQAFQRLLGQLAALNRKPLLMIFDEPPASVREALSLTPPEGVRLLTIVNSNQTGDGLGMIVDLGRRWKAASAELYGESARAFFDHQESSLLRIALGTEMENEGLTLDDSLGLAEEAVLELDALYRPLLAALSLEKSPVSLDDIDQWFLDSEEVTSCLKAFPSLFNLASTRLSPVMGLAHLSIRKLVVETLDEERALIARKLLGWVVAQLERTAPDRYAGLQVREIVFRNFLRLYRYASACQDPAILEWVIRNKELQRRRISLTEHLERPGSRYDLQELLRLLSELLGQLVDTGNCDDLRDELAWAESNLALNQLKLGLLPQAKKDIDRAIEVFEVLVSKEKQYEFRPALSTTYYRASRICESAGETENALGYANRAVQGFVDLVEDRGRSELAPRLGLALAHRGGLHYIADDLAAAKADLQKAFKLLASADTGQSVNESYRTQVEIQLELAAILTKEGEYDNAIQESGKAVQLATEAVEEKGLDEFQPLLATCHAVRAKANFKKGDHERAVRDIAKSISLRNLSVDEGRLDQRYHLAKDLQLRAQIDQGRGALEDASRDLKQAIELLDTLSSEGRTDAEPQLLRCLQDRAKINLASGDSQSGTQDLKRALALLDKSAPQPALKLSIMETMLTAYVQTGNTSEALSVSQTLLASYHQAQQWESYGNVQLIRATALEKSGDLKAAHEAYTQAVSLIGQLLSQGQSDELLIKVSQAYLGLGAIDFKLGQPAQGVPQLKQAIDVLLHLFQQRGKYEVLPQLLKAYSLFSAGNTEMNRLAEANQALQSGFDVLGYMESHGGQGGVPTASGLEHEKGGLHRQRANLLLAQGDTTNALNDAEEAIRNFLATRQRDQNGPWKDEMARTWVLRSRILFAAKDFAQADKSIQEAISHFEERVREGQYGHFSDMLEAFGVRADHAAKSGKVDLVLEEYNRMLAITTSAAQSGADIDHEVEMARIFEKRALVYQQQNLLNEAYADFENVIGLYRTQLSTKGRSEFASDLVRTFLSRGKMTTRAGHGQHAIGDFSEAVNVAKALVSQGQVAAVPDLATALHERAEVYRALGKGSEALRDLQGCVGFRMQLIQTSQEPELIGELGRALLMQGGLLIAAGQLPQAAQSLDQANAFFTNLVEGQGRQEYSSELAQSLIQRVSLSSDKRDPALREVLIKAVNLVNQQAQEGKPIGRDFTIECLKTVVELLQQEDFNAIGTLIDSVLSLVETVVTDNRGDQDFVKLTDLLLAASAGLIDDRRTSRRPHFLSLACVSCNREIQMFGNNSLPRLVYCLYELGQALERSKPPNVLNYIGSSFALLGELAGQQQANEDFMRELKMMISTWRSLPPQVPALANVSRHMLSQLLRLT
jgi:tetratricopeptide (TPR) repeat protein